MIELPVYNKDGKQVSSLAIDEAQLGSEVRPALLKQAYVMFHANLRQGSARTKSRGLVAGSTRKLYKQKHTGNARAGMVRTPIRKGGGRAFAKLKTHEEFRLDMPKRMRRLANRNALLAKLVDSEVKCFDKLSFSEPSTGAFDGLLKAVGIDRTCLIALDPANENARRSARNLANVDVVRVDQLNAFDLLNHRYLVVEQAGLQAFLDGSAWSGGEDAEPNGAAKRAPIPAPQKSPAPRKSSPRKKEAAR